MRRKLQRFIGLIAAAALCFAAPAGAMAAEPNVLWDFRQGMDSAVSEPMEITTFSDDDTSSTGTTGTDTTVTNTGYYTVTIPAQVSVSSTDAAGKPTADFKITGTVNPYRKLTIGVSSKNDDKLECGSSALAYTLSANSSDNSLTIDNTSKKYSLETDADKKDFAADLTVNVTDTPTVSGEYTDTLTFTMECEKTSKTIRVFYEKLNSYKCISSSYKDKGYPHIGQERPDSLIAYEEEHESENIEVPPNKTKTYTIENKDSNQNLWENTTCTVNVNANDGETEYQVHFYRKMCQLDLNIAVWNETTGTYETYNKSTDTVKTDDLLKTDIYINDKRVATQQSDHYTGYPCGLEYKFENIKAQSGYELVGYTTRNITKDTQGKVHTEWAEGEEKKITGTLPGLETGASRNGDGTYGSVIMWLVLEKTSGTTTQSLPLTDDGTTMMDSMRVSMESQLADLTDDTADTTTDSPASSAPADDYVVEDYPVVFFETSIGNGE